MTTAETDYLTHDHNFLGRAHDDNARRTLWVVALTAVMMAGEILAGLLYGSMALLADGFHMATHAGALASRPAPMPMRSAMPPTADLRSAPARWGISPGSPQRSSSASSPWASQESPWVG